MLGQTKSLCNIRLKAYFTCLLHRNYPKTQTVQKKHMNFIQEKAEQNENEWIGSSQSLCDLIVEKRVKLTYQETASKQQGYLEMISGAKHDY